MSHCLTIMQEIACTQLEEKEIKMEIELNELKDQIHQLKDQILQKENRKLKFELKREAVLRWEAAEQAEVERRAAAEQAEVERREAAEQAEVKRMKLEERLREMEGNISRQNNMCCCILL